MKRVVKTTLSIDTPRSGAIEHIWYDSANRELYARYRGSQSISGYADVSQVAVDRLIAAPSIGGHFDRYVKKADYKGINTDTVELVEPYEQPKTAQAFKATSWGGQLQSSTPKKLTNAKRFRVKGVVLAPVDVTEVFTAETLDEAIAKFREKHDGKEPQVEGVVKID